MRAIAVACLVTVAASSASAAGIWLDAPLTSWNERAGTDGLVLARSATTFRARCGVNDLRTSAGQRAVSQSGRVAFLPFDRDGGLTHADIEIVGGMSDATDACAPASFNFFVFVAGIYAGTLSPVDMTTGKDGVIGIVRFPPGDVITAEFVRYGVTDTECCPSGRARVTYKVARTPAGAVIVPTELHKIR
jgi:hypothetical protein